MNTFEYNSVHLCSAGYKFGMALLQGEVTMEKLGVDDNPIYCPIWIHEGRSTDDEIAVIVGSEPQIGKNPEIRIPSAEIKQMVYTEPIPVPEND